MLTVGWTASKPEAAETRRNGTASAAAKREMHAEGAATAAPQSGRQAASAGNATTNGRLRKRSGKTQAEARRTAIECCAIPAIPSLASKYL